MAEFDSPELRKLAVDFDAAADVAPAEVRKAIAKGAVNIKTGARRRVSGRAHLPRYPHSITYDSTATPTGGYADIGPDKSRPQGALGNIIEFGGLREAPIPHMGPEADRELPRLERAIADLGGRLLR